jgi:hypothetical protein
MVAETQTSERVDRPTPNGGAYSVANFLDSQGRPCPKAQAVGMEIMEFDAADQCVGRTYLAQTDNGPPAPDAWIGESSTADA